MSEPTATVSTGKPISQKRWTAKTWLIFLAIMLPVLGGGGWMFVAAERQTREDPALASLARSNAGGEVQAFTGAKHTVYQSVAPLPSEDSPRADAKLTLVWFTTSNCTDCGRMDDFAHRVAAQFTARLAFVEKAADRDTSAARLGVTEAPTFVLIDDRGQELERFGFERTQASFSARVEAALRAAGR
ncbi:MAG: thioredoxin family protein [Tepidiformaceae bacterium]